MILNSYTILIAFIGGLRLACAGLVLGVGAFAWRAGGTAATPEARTALENRCYLLFLLALLLLGLNLASWPLFYLLLQSYVPEWEGVMCIYGVTKIGVGSVGVSRHLPGLLKFLQATKPALVFAGGAWFVLYLLNRRTETSPLLRRLFLLLLPLGVLAVSDAVAELAYISIPKKEEFPNAGCCTAATDEAETAAKYLPRALVGAAGRPWLDVAYFGGTLALIAGLIVATRRTPGPVGLAALVAAGAAVTAASGVYVVEVAAPTLLGLPFHHCPYDLIPRVPEAVVAVALMFVGCFALGWAGMVKAFGRGPETDPLLPGTVQGLLRLSLWGYTTSLAMLSLELILA